MARPIKHNADYFPHDSDMRNDARVKAVRRKFGLNGYAIYVMLIEYLADSDNFYFTKDDLTIELIAGDFDIEPKELIEVLDYCIKIDLFQEESAEITCKSLENRLNPLLTKRKRDRIEVIDSDNTHSKVKESKEKKSKVDESKENETLLVKDFNWFLNQFDEIFVDTIKMTHKGKDFMQAAKESYAHLAADKMRLNRAESQDCKKLLNTWLSNQKNNGKQITNTESRVDKYAAYFANKDNKGAGQ